MTFWRRLSTGRRFDNNKKATLIVALFLFAKRSFSGN